MSALGTNVRKYLQLTKVMQIPNKRSNLLSFLVISNVILKTNSWNYRIQLQERVYLHLCY